jgi:hypothetical protein
MLTQKNSICTSSLYDNSDVDDPEIHAVFDHILAKKHHPRRQQGRLPHYAPHPAAAQREQRLRRPRCWGGERLRGRQLPRRALQGLQS